MSEFFLILIKSQNLIWQSGKLANWQTGNKIYPSKKIDFLTVF
jgi:hypothetical protein